MQRRAKVFMNNRSQAVRLPKDFQFDTDEVFIRKEGEDVILSPRPTDWEPYLESGPGGSPSTEPKFPCPSTSVSTDGAVHARYRHVLPHHEALERDHHQAITRRAGHRCLRLRDYEVGTALRR